MRGIFGGNRRLVLIGISAFLVMLALLCADTAYRKMNEKTYRPKLERAQALMAREKEWILANVGESGEIYMNGADAGDVNPYFSCRAALGLLEGTAAEREISAVSRYLNRHTEILLDSDGAVGVYEEKGDTLVRTDKGDSEDAYLGVYLELLGKYLLTVGGTEELYSWEEGLRTAVDALESLTEDGLTKVSAANDTKYLMDNLEAWKGLATAEDGLDALFGDSAALSDVRERIGNMRRLMEERITEAFWDKKEKRWMVIEGVSSPAEEFYPDWVAQIYPLIYEFPVKSRSAQRRLYHDFSEEFSWETVEKDPTEFVWAMVGMGAAQTGDAKKLEDFLQSYEEAFSSDRSYPLYTGEAGWVCRECEWFCSYCMKKINSGILPVI